MPVLPTRIHNMNRNIVLYNNLVDNMLLQSFAMIGCPGLYHFLDNKKLLSVDLTRDGNDNIHLGDKGMAKFVSCMKFWIFERERRDSRVNSSRGHRQQSATGSVSPEQT